MDLNGLIECNPGGGAIIILRPFRKLLRFVSVQLSSELFSENQLVLFSLRETIMDQTKNLYTIQQVSYKLEIPKSTLRFWEKELNGLITLHQSECNCLACSNKVG